MKNTTQGQIGSRSPCLGDKSVPAIKTGCLFNTALHMSFHASHWDHRLRQAQSCLCLKDRDTERRSEEREEAASLDGTSAAVRGRRVGACRCSSAVTAARCASRRVGIASTRGAGVRVRVRVRHGLATCAVGA